MIPGHCSDFLIFAYFMLKKLARFVQQFFSLFGYIIEKKEKFIKNDPNNWLQKLEIKTVLDIGANNGQFISYIRKFLPFAVIHSFEPINSCFNSLQLLSMKGLTLYNYGLSDVEGETEINISKNLVSSSIFGANDILTDTYPDAMFIGRETIKLIPLDKILKEVSLEYNVLIKIDVQGYEEKVIKGGIETIKKASAVLIEVSFRQLYSSQWLFDDVYRSLVDLGFVFNGLLEQFENKESQLPIYADALFVRNEVLNSI